MVKINLTQKSDQEPLLWKATLTDILSILSILSTLSNFSADTSTSVHVVVVVSILAPVHKIAHKISTHHAFFDLKKHIIHEDTYKCKYIVYKPERSPVHRYWRLHTKLHIRLVLTMPSSIFKNT